MSPLTSDRVFFVQVSRPAVLEQTGIVLAKRSRRGGLADREEGMTKSQWLLLGAVVLGIAVGAYILFFCPTDCH